MTDTIYTGVLRSRYWVFAALIFAFFSVSGAYAAAPANPPYPSTPGYNATNVPTNKTFAWNTATGATSYKVQIGTNSNFQNGIIYNESGLTGTELTVSGLATSTTHYWRLKSVNTDGESAWSNAWQLTTAAQNPPNTPSLDVPASQATNVCVNTTVRWMVTAGTATYKLQICNNSSFQSGFKTNVSNLSDTAYSVNGLSISTNYYWRVKAVSSYGESAWSSARQFTTANGTPPNAPYPVTPGYQATNVPTSKTFAWWKITGASSYGIQVCSNSSFQNGLIVNQTGITDSILAVSGLSVSTTYYWRTRATNSYGDGLWGNYWQFTTAAGNPPNAPTLDNPSNNATSVFVNSSVKWFTTANATSYKLQVSTNSSFQNSFAANQSNLTDTAYSLTGLAISTVYYWRVKAVGSYGESAWSSIRQFTTANGAPPNAPYGITPGYEATNIPTNKTFRWWHVTGATSYSIQVCSNSSFNTGIVVNQSGISDSTLAVTGLAISTTYYWRTRSSSSYGDGTWSSPWQFTTAAGNPPNTPYPASPNYEQTDIPLNKTFAWWHVTGATSYAIQICSNSSFQNGMIVNQSGISDSLFAVNGLSASTVYYWRLQAANSYGESNWSNPWQFTTTAGNPPDAPTLSSPAHQATNISLNPSLSWNSVSGATSYSVMVSANADFSSPNVNTTYSSTSYSVSGLSANTVYYWRINAISQYGTSNWSDVRSFTTGASGGSGGSGGNGGNNGGSGGNNGGNNNSNDVDYYVDGGAASNGNGSQYSPFQTITAAYNAANEAKKYTIRVAGGTYTENIGSDTDLYGINREYVFLGGYGVNFINRDKKTLIVGAEKHRPVFEFYNAAAVTIDGFDISGGKSGIQSLGWASSRVATITNNRIHDNGFWTSHDSYDSVMYGGGIGIDATTTLIEKNIIENNTGHDFGGGIRATSVGTDGLTTITQNMVRDNLNVGGASHGSGMLINGNTRIEKNTVDHNTFNTSYGGTQTGVGGGIIVIGGDSSIINANLIIRNTGHSGAGLMLDEAATALITNNIIARNYSYQRGGGVRIDGASANSFSYATLHNNTIVFNTQGADPDGNGGHGLHVTDAQVTGANNLFWGNGEGDNDLYLSGDNSTIELSYSLLNDFALTDTASDMGSVPSLDNTNLLAGTDITNPHFIDTAADNFRLEIGSPLTDAGISTFGNTNSIPAKDFDGGNRPLGNSVDIGADEVGSGMNTDHPRLLITPAIKEKLVAKMQANDAAWVTLKTRADQLKNYAVTQYKTSTAYNWFQNTIFYGYQGNSWYDDIIPLAFAWQVSGDTNYCNKLIEVADEMIRAEYDSENIPPVGHSPMMLGNAYPSRFVGPSAALIYDWCYDRLGESRKQQLITLFNKWYDSLRVPGGGAYENNGPSNGNHFSGHMFAAGWMGYATFGENPRAGELIDWARARMDGTMPYNTTFPANQLPESSRNMDFDGWTTNYVGSIYGVPDTAHGIHGAPFKGGFNYQGWAYGNGDFSSMIDFMQLIKTASGDDLFADHHDWFSGMLNSQRHALMPNRFMIDPIGDWGGNNANAIYPDLPHRVSFVLEGTDEGPAAQYFANTYMAQNHTWNYYGPDIRVIELDAWEDLYYRDAARSSQNNTIPPYYNNIPTVNPNGASPNGAIPYYIMRSNWDTSAVWASLQMGSAHWGDHHHNHAGHLHIVRGKDQLLISPSNWKGDGTGLGIQGNGIAYTDYSGVKNTLFFDDFGDYKQPSSGTIGGQSVHGFDRPITNELNDDYSYMRSDLVSAYNYSGWNSADQSTTELSDTTERKLEKFFRNFFYLRSQDVFVVFDQVKAKNSTNQLGQYKKVLRWHFPVEPTISGKGLRVDKGASRLYMHTLLPESLGYNKYYLGSGNPDNTYNNPDLAYLFNSPTWRVEVSDTLNPLELPFMSVFQVGKDTLGEMTTTSVRSLDSLMLGTTVESTNGSSSLILFNNREGIVQEAISSTSYVFNGSADAQHILCGMIPDAQYHITTTTTADGLVFSAEEVGSGEVTASEGGVVRFVPSDLGLGKASSDNPIGVTGKQNEPVLYPNAPNPFAQQTAITFSLPESGVARIAIYNALGVEVAVVANKYFEQGLHSVTWVADGASAGAYSCELRVNGQSKMIKLLHTP